MKRVLRRCGAWIVAGILLSGMAMAEGPAGGLIGIEDRHGKVLTGNIGAWPYEEGMPLSESGNRVRLTVDAGLQDAVEQALANAIARAAERANPRAGAAVVLDMQGRVLAMASYPAEGQVNHAIQTRAAPGPAMHIVTALAGLVEDEVAIWETISDEGPYTMYNMADPPHCWIPQNRLQYHAEQTVVEALSHVCSYYFFTVASRLGADGEALGAFARRMGVSGLTGIELPCEVGSIFGGQAVLYDPERPLDEQKTAIPAETRAELTEILVELAGDSTQAEACADALMQMAATDVHGERYQHWIQRIVDIVMDRLALPEETVRSERFLSAVIEQLNRIKWVGSMTLEAATGEGITAVTPLALARLFMVVSNGGYVYDTQIVDSVRSAEGEVLASFDSPASIRNLSEEIGLYLPYIYTGLRGVVDHSGLSVKYFVGDDPFPHLDNMCGIVSAPETSPETGWFAGFAPYDRPEIALVIYIDGTAEASNTAPAAREILTYYFDHR